MLVGIVGKTNVGKTTFFSAATLVDAEISSRVFTTIEPNKGMAYVRKKCPCKELGLTCSPKNSKCIDGTRLVPVKVVDIAGIVPDAHLGKGLGNQFLSDIMEADALIHVVDISGSTDANGNQAASGSNDPLDDIAFFEKEVDYWLLGIVRKAGIGRISPEKLADALWKQLSGLSISKEDVEHAIKEAAGATADKALLEFIRILRKKSKPMVIAANKIDIKGASEIFERVKSTYPIIPCSAEAELALRRAAEKGIIKYVPGAPGFEIAEQLDSRQKNALEFVRSLLQRLGSTGVQTCIDAAAKILGMVVVYPVEDEQRLSDKKGNILPDAFLMKKGATALDLAYRVHEDIGKKFIAAVDCRSKRHVSADYELKDGDIISIKAGR